MSGDVWRCLAGVASPYTQGRTRMHPIVLRTWEMRASPTLQSSATMQAVVSRALDPDVQRGIIGDQTETVMPRPNGQDPIAPIRIVSSLLSIQRVSNRMAGATPPQAPTEKRGQHLPAIWRTGNEITNTEYDKASCQPPQVSGPSIFEAYPYLPRSQNLTDGMSAFWVGTLPVNPSRQLHQDIHQNVQPLIRVV